MSERSLTSPGPHCQDFPGSSEVKESACIAGEPGLIPGLLTKESEMLYLDAISKTTEEESEKVGLKLNIQYIKIMASGSISSWQINESNRNSERLYFGGLQNH